MNWYKIANVLQEELDDARGLEEVTNILDKHGLQWSVVKLKDETILKVNNQIILDLDYPQLEDAQEWIYGLYGYSLSFYVDFKDFQKEFWEDAGNGLVVYHSTNTENIPNIKKEGLTVQNKTRGISNRLTPSAIFTSTSPDDIGYYGGEIIEIHLHKMKEDGFTPAVGLEEPVEEAQYREALAHKLGLFDMDFMSELNSEGIYDTTVVFYEDIPPQYLIIQ